MDGALCHAYSEPLTSNVIDSRQLCCQNPLLVSLRRGLAKAPFCRAFVKSISAQFIYKVSRARITDTAFKEYQRGSEEKQRSVLLESRYLFQVIQNFRLDSALFYQKFKLIL